MASYRGGLGIRTNFRKIVDQDSYLYGSKHEFITRTIKRKEKKGMVSTEHVFTQTYSMVFTRGERISYRLDVSSGSRKEIH
jgi:hypothetical protein